MSHTIKLISFNNTILETPLGISYRRRRIRRSRTFVLRKLFLRAYQKNFTELILKEIPFVILSRNKLFYYIGKIVAQFSQLSYFNTTKCGFLKIMITKDSTPNILTTEESLNQHLPNQQNTEQIVSSTVLSKVLVTIKEDDLNI